MSKMRIRLGMLFATIGCSISLHSHAYSYSVTNLGTLGYSSEALAISNTGNIVGDSSLTQGGIQATYFSSTSAPTALTPDASRPYARVFGVNDIGQIVGYGMGNQWGWHAIVMDSNSNAIDLGTIGGFSSQANAINNFGQIVGSSNITPSGWSHAALFGIGLTPVDLGVLSGGNWSNATAINDKGVIVGSSASIWGSHAALFSLFNGPIDLDPTWTGGSASALGINNLGIIVGARQNQAWDPTIGMYQQQHAVIFGEGIAPIDLGTLGGTTARANDINDKGLIVGMSSLNGLLDPHATLFSENGSPIDLNSLIDPSSGWTLQEATAINDKGEIVGYGIFNGQTLAFLATPIPEPGTLALLLISMPPLRWLVSTRRNRYQARKG